MGNPRVTALIDTYNQGRFIEEAIESVLAQDFPASEMEILVVDDGSTDDTRARVEKYGDRVRYIYKVNGGQASALNCGFAESRGQIVAMLDADDLWLPGRVRGVLREFERHPEAAMVYNPYRFWNTQSNTYTDDTTFYPISGYVPARVTDVLHYGCFGTSCMALRRAMTQELFPIPTVLKVYADTYLILLMIFLAPVAAIPEHLTVYRHHGGNSTAFRGGDPERLRQRWYCYERGVAEARAWLERKGHDLHLPAPAAHFRRHELVAEEFRFLYEGAERWQLYCHLKSGIELFRPLWSVRYRIYRHLLASAGFLMGYDRFTQLRANYRGAPGALRLRDLAFPNAAVGRSAHLMDAS
jgi:glycosyltransferase involved in cell wall biosynthesis